MASGDPFTTLFNTFRTILYYKYALRDVYPAPGMVAAGDDANIFPTDANADKCRDLVLSHTSRTPNINSPLG
jgi:hypothetical protein